VPLRGSVSRRVGRVLRLAVLSVSLLVMPGRAAVGLAAPLADAVSPLAVAMPDALVAHDRALDDLLQQAPGRTYALLLNGGGRPEINYHSHLSHLIDLVGLLRTRGVAADDILVFSSDGGDPAHDLATRELNEDPGFWLLPARGLARALHPPITFADSAIDGVALRPARKEALRRGLAELAARLLPGDTLLLYVTDHGDKNEKDLADNAITLWGGESLSVAELRALLRPLDRRVRIVLLMSQCYAGSFANAILLDDDGVLPAGNVCGYFAATADRWAYGCYPENRGKEGIGYSHHFFDALGQLARFPDAHRRVLVTDGTPDVPHTTTDFFLERRLELAAQAAGRPEAALVDELLAEAWQRRAAWEPEIRLLDRIGETFGSFSPRSLAELEEQAARLPEFSKRLGTYAGRWQDALEALRLQNLERFLAARPAWRKRLDAKTLDGIDAATLRTVTRELLGELVPFTEADGRTHERLQSLKRKAEDAAAASYRAEVRLGVVLRMRALLTAIAGRVYMARTAPASERAAFARLTACENLSLDHAPTTAPTELPAPEPFPRLAEEQQIIDALMPAYMGIHFRPLAETQRKRTGAAAGAVTVLTVSPDSPAAEAGLEVGDVILGPTGEPFTEPEQVREWTMWREVGVPATLDVLRDAKPLQITLKPSAYPLELPKLPGPPEIGSAAPPLKVDVLRAADRLAEHQPRLLFFWATWCVICKHSLPEVLAFADERHTEIVAITDEDRETVDRFLMTTQDETFPRVVASDPLRATFQSYGVSGTPTFVLIDADGIVRHVQTGYTREGLRVEGWHWEASRSGATVRGDSPAVRSQSKQ
jgi:thiol-disulfide isomerase/thioredoxin